MVLDKVLHFGMELIKHISSSGDDVGFIAVASGKVLRGNDANLIPFLRLNEQHFRVVVREMCGVDDLMDEVPQGQRFVRCFEVKYQMDACCVSATSDEVQAAQELLRDGEGRLPHLTGANLLQHPFEDVRNLHSVSQCRLHGGFAQRAEDLVDGCCALHLFS